jgi:hypothetical protein
MAWADNLLDATFRGVPFECVSTTDAETRALVKHQYPYVDGADVEDMGADAATISVQAVFYGPDYESRLQQFLDVLDNKIVTISEEEDRKGGWLQHPVFGMLFVQVASRTISHDAESVDEARVQIEFIVSIPSAPFFSRELAVQKADAVPQHGLLATAAATNGIASLIDRLRAANPLAGLDALRQTLTAPLLAITAQTGVVLSGLDVLAYPRAWGNDISALALGILDMREFGSNLSGDWAGIKSDLDAFSLFSSPDSAFSQAASSGALLDTTPEPVTSSGTPTESQAIAAAAATVQVNKCVCLANAAGYVLAAEADTPTMSPLEIEITINQVRIEIEITINQVRNIYGIEYSRTITEPLKGQGLAVQEAARAVIAARPPLIQRQAEAPGNLRLLAHLFYGDHTRAAELYRLNGARSPFVNAGGSVHVYAR